jgi:hypothetical protein
MRLAFAIGTTLSWLGREIDAAARGADADKR